MNGYETFSFVDNVEKKHFVLLHDEPEFAKMIEFRFIKNGLEKGEHCIFSTRENKSDIESQMKNQGINVEKYKEKKLLQFFYPSDPMNDDDGVLKGFEKISSEMLRSSKPPFRIVIGTAFCDTYNREGMLAELEIERHLHSTFEGFLGSVLCSYSFGEIASSGYTKSISKLLDSHHSLIFAPKNNNTITFDISKTKKKCMSCGHYHPNKTCKEYYEQAKKS